MESPQIVLLMIVSAATVAFAVWLIFGMSGCLKEEVEAQTPEFEQKTDVTPVGQAIMGLSEQIQHDLYFGETQTTKPIEPMPEFKYTITYVDGSSKKKKKSKKYKTLLESFAEEVPLKGFKQKSSSGKRKPSKKKPKKKSKR